MMLFQACIIPRRYFLRLLLSAMLGFVPIATLAATYTVTSDSDAADPTDNQCTLREAMQRAFNDGGDSDCGKDEATADNKIVFANSMDIKLNNTLPDIQNKLVIDAEQYGVTINSNGNRIFNLPRDEADLSLFNIILRNDSGTIVSGAGGAVSVQKAKARFTATQVRFVLNTASSNGGAIHSLGQLQLTDVIFDGNHSNNHGGAIYATNGDLFLTNVEFVANSADGNGGAMAIHSNTTSQQNVALVAVDYIGNIANGDTNQESGGGALWLKNSGNDKVRFLLMLNTFEYNTAENGNGGAILITNNTAIDFPDEIELEDYVTNTLPKLATHLDSGLFKPHTFDPNKWLDTGALLAKGFYSVHFHGNQSLNGAGGAIYSRGETGILSSSFQGNVSQSGGAIAHNPSSIQVLTLANTTLVHNNATGNGSAIANLDDGQVELINVTMAYNPGNNAIYSVGDQFRTRNTLITHNGNANCLGPVIADTSTIQYAPNSGCGSAWVTDPELFPVPVLGVGLLNVVAILPFFDDSPANGAGDPGICSAAPIFNVDARGLPFTRPGLLEQGTSCDIGAYESMGGALIHSTGLDFGRVYFGNYLDKKATLINTSGRDLTIALSLSALGDFSIVNDGCSGDLPSGANCAVSIRFEPTSFGDHINTLKVSAQKGNFNVVIDEIPLTGSGSHVVGRIPDRPEYPQKPEK